MKQRGFTILEIVIVIAFLLILTSMVLPTSLRFRSSGDINAVINNFISDAKNQQIKAMLGDTEGGGIVDKYGIYLTSNKYVLFHGSTYSSSDTNNLSINMKSGIQILNSFPNNSIIFIQKSGEIASYNSGSDTITIKDNNNSISRILKFNKYGSIIDNNEN